LNLHLCQAELQAQAIPLNLGRQLRTVARHNRDTSETGGGNCYRLQKQQIPRIMKTAQPHLIDTTLRNGEQATGVNFSLNEKLEITQKLDELGIPELEIGTPAMGDEEQNDISTLLSQGFGFAGTCWCRATMADLQAALKCGATRVNLSFPMSGELVFSHE